MIVITYQLAYRSQIQISLCPKCQELARQQGSEIPALGPVQHGQHQGECDWCEGDRIEFPRAI